MSYEDRPSSFVVCDHFFAEGVGDIDSADLIGLEPMAAECPHRLDDLATWLAESQFDLPPDAWLQELEALDAMADEEVDL